jgi:hypothetical protein
MALAPDRRQALTALGAALACAPRAFGQTAPVELGLTEARARFFLPVRIGAEAPVSFMLDTGSPAHIISESLASRLDLRVVGRRRLQAWDGGGDSPLVRAEQFEVGGLDLGPTLLVAWPDSRLEGRDGLLGYPLVAQGAVLSLAAGKLSIRTPWGARGTQVSAEVSRNGAMLLGGLPGSDGRFAFDTGAQELTISPAYHRRILTNPAYLAAPKIMVRGPSGRPDPSQILGFRPESLRFGDLVCAAPLVHIAPEDDGRDGVFQGVDGLVGVALLRRYVWNIEPGRLTVLAEASRPVRPAAAQAAPLAIPAEGGPSPIGGVSFGPPAFEPASK